MAAKLLVSEFHGGQQKRGNDGVAAVIADGIVKLAVKAVPEVCTDARRAT